MRDLYNNLVVTHVMQEDVSDNTAAVGAIIDNQDNRGILYVINAGALADADATFTVLLEEGDDSSLSDNSAVADADLLGTEAGASFQFDDDDGVFKIGYRGTKRYTRMTITPAGNASAASFGVVAIQSPHRSADA